MKKTETATQPTVQTIAPAQKTQKELIAEAKRYGIPTDGLEKMPAVAFDQYVRPALIAQITAKISEHLTQVYVDINTQLQEMHDGPLATLLQICRENNVTSLTLEITADCVSAKRTLRTKSESSANGERKSHSTGLEFTDGTRSAESLRKLVEMFVPADELSAHMNGKSICQKLKSAKFPATQWSVIDDKKETTTPFDVWAAANYEVKFN